MKRQIDDLQVIQHDNLLTGNHSCTNITGKEQMICTTNSYLPFEDDYLSSSRVGKNKMRKLENFQFHISSPVVSVPPNVFRISESTTGRIECLHEEHRRDKSNSGSDHRVLETTPDHPPCFLSAMPQELIFQIVSYIGPNSSSLKDLARVNKMFHRTLSIIADSIMENVKHYFRIPLPKLHVQESKLSHSIRHYRSFLDIRNKSNELKRLIEKDFVVNCFLGPVIIRPMSPRCPNSTRMIEGPTGGEPISMEEIEHALDIALELIGLDSLSYFLAKGSFKITDIDEQLVFSSSRLNMLRHFSGDLEDKVFALVGRCGGKVYKYLRMHQILMKLWHMNDKMATFSNYNESVFHRRVADLMIRAKTLIRLVIFRENDFFVEDTECILVRVNSV
jgi:hypothetical protein